MIKKTLALAAILVVVILGYGYWHVSVYGWLHISLRDDSSAHKHEYRLIKDAKITLLDSGGNTLAEGLSDKRHGVVYLYHPEAGLCVEEESRAPFSQEDRQRWYACYEKQAKWVVEWIGEVEYINLKFDTCEVKHIPVTVTESKGDWWLWWVPLPHVGGKPSTYYYIDIEADRDRCTAKVR